MENELLLQTLKILVMNHPKLTGAKYTYMLRSNGYPLITKHEVNSILYNTKESFQSNFDGFKPAWTLTFLEHIKIIQLTIEMINSKEININTDDIELNDPPRIKLYPWQMRALKVWEENRYRGLVEAVTGSGKTHLALAAMETHLKEGWKVAVIFPSKELQNQWHNNICICWRPLKMVR